MFVKSIPIMYFILHQFFSDLPGNNLLVQKSEKPSHGLDLETDPKLIDNIRTFENNEMMRKKKIDKIELTIKGENEAYPKDAPYTQGSAAARQTYSTAHLISLAMLTAFLCNFGM